MRFKGESGCFFILYSKGKHIQLSIEFIRLGMLFPFELLKWIDNYQY
jgi:hypothetical protein